MLLNVSMPTQEVLGNTDSDIVVNLKLMEAIMHESNERNLSIIRLKQVQKRTGLSRSTIYLRIQESSFPRPLKLGGPRAVGWLESEIDAWLAKHVAIRDNS